MKKNYYINYMDYYIPETQIDAETVLRSISSDKQNKIKNFEQHITSFLDETKLHKISCFETKRDFSKNAYNLVARMIEKTNINPKDISYILCGSQHLFNKEGISIVQSIKNDFDFFGCMILPIMQPCAATLCGINIAERLLEDDKYILVISGCCWDNIDERYIDFSIRGDGISIMLLSRNAGRFCVKGCNVHNYNNSVLNIDGSLKYEPTLGRLNLICTGSKFVVDSIRKFDVDIDEISKIIQPNTGYFVFHDLYTHYTKIEPEKFFFDNVSRGGHICDIDIVRNLIDYDNKERLQTGARVMLYTPDVEPTFDVNYHSVLLEKC